MQPWKLHIILHYLNSDRDKHETEEPCIAPNPLTIASSLSITTKVPRSRLNQAAWPIGRYFIMVGPSKLPLLTIFVDASFMLGKFSQAKAPEFKVQTEQNHFTPAAVHGIHYKMVHIYRVSRQGLPTALFKSLKPAFLFGCDSFSLPYRAPGPRPGSEKSTDTVRLQCRKKHWLYASSFPMLLKNWTLTQRPIYRVGKACNHCNCSHIINYNYMKVMLEKAEMRGQGVILGLSWVRPRWDPRIHNSNVFEHTSVDPPTQ